MSGVGAASLDDDGGGRRERASGHFLLTSSVAGRRALPGSLYSSTKWAVTGMGEALRQELADTPIKVTLRDALGVGSSFLYRMHLDLASLSVAEFYPDGASSVRLVNQTSYL